MKNHRTLTALVLLLMSTAVIAQGPGNHKMRSATENATRQTVMLAQSLGLNSEQIVQIQNINLKYATNDSIRFAEMRNGQSTENVDRQTIMKKMKEERAAKKAEIESVLTDAQKTKYEALEKERQNRGLKGQGNPPDGGQPPVEGQGGNQPEN
jgi:hypothetical protein